MIHCLVPLKGPDREKAEQQPAFFVESGVPMILEALLKRGAQKKDLIIVLAGCAQINADHSIFEIGKKNLTICKKILWKNSLLIKAEHCGGDFSRTLAMDVGSGRVTVKSQGVVEEVSEARV
jgi:chemotaxis protein CheD